MLHRFTVRHSFLTFHRRLSSDSRVIPSTTQSLLLKNLPTTATEKSVHDALKSVTFRKLELEPGCSLHFMSESDASLASEIIRGDLNLETRIQSATMPSLVLKNLPESTTRTSLGTAFSNYNPKALHLLGRLQLQVIVKDESSAAKIAGLIKSAQIESCMLQTEKLASGEHSVNILAPVDVNVQQLTDTVKNTINTDSSIQIEKIVTLSPPTKSFQLRFDGLDDLTKIESHFQEPKDGLAIVGSNIKLRKPAVVLRNAKHLRTADVNALFSQYHPERIQAARDSKGKLDTVVAYFKSERSALSCLQSIKGARFNDRTLSAVYREMEEPVVRIAGLPEGTSEEEVKELCRAVTVEHVVMDFSGTGATVFVSSAQEAKLISAALDGRMAASGLDDSEEKKEGKEDEARTLLRTQRMPVIVTDKGFTLADHPTAKVQRLSAIAGGFTDKGITLAASDPSVKEAAVSAAIASLGLEPKSISQDSNVSAVLSFLSTKEAVTAQNELLRGIVKIDSNDTAATGGGVVSSTLTVFPSYVVQVRGLDVNTPASTVVDALSAKCPSVKVLKVDRSALVKMMRSKDVVPGIKSLSAIQIQGKSMSVEKYRPLSHPGSSQYDLPAGHSHNEVDQFSLKMLLKDYMHADPATRYQVAKNYFERALHDATKLNEISAVLEKGATAAQTDEVKRLVATISEDTNEQASASASKRLFQLFLQREDMDKFSSDFKEIEAFLGPANEADPFDWSQFQADHESTLERLRSETKRLEAQAAEDLLNRLRGREPKDDDDESEEDDDEEEDDDDDDEEDDDEEEEEGENGSIKKEANELNIPGEMGAADTTVSLEDPENLVDREGNTWSGVILDTDMVQKTTPGQRVATHRCLVMVGNLRGAGGFGMGKGRTPADALNAAFRAALRNVQHIDLYENYGLAHDLHGYHNSCHAYIRATPKSRNMIASSFAEAILIRFGISSASCKLIGRRDPYAMVNAIFKALGQHENIDEFAKDRGKRYITLKWAYENGV